MTQAAPTKTNNLSPRARKILRALVEVVLPRNDQICVPMEDEVEGFVDEFVGHFPALLRVLFPLGLYVLEYGTWLFAFTWRSFSKMSAAQRERYLDGWSNSRFGLKRELVKGVKGLVLLYFYSDERVCEQIGYRHPEWISYVKKRRLDSYADDIAARERFTREQRL